MTDRNPLMKKHWRFVSSPVFGYILPMAYNKDMNAWKSTWLLLAGRSGLVMLVVLLLMVLSVFPFFSGEFSAIRPAFLLIAVYYWAITRPGTFSYLPVFVTGLLLDLIADYPMGISAMTFIAVRWITVSQRKFLMGQSFQVIWAGFAFVSFAAAIAQWIIFMIFNAEIMTIRNVLMSALLTAAIFPLLVPLLAMLNRILAEYHEP